MSTMRASTACTSVALIRDTILATWYGLISPVYVLSAAVATLGLEEAGGCLLLGNGRGQAR